MKKVLVVTLSLIIFSTFSGCNNADIPPTYEIVNANSTSVNATDTSLENNTENIRNIEHVENTKKTDDVNNNAFTNPIDCKKYESGKSCSSSFTVFLR